MKWNTNVPKVGDERIVTRFLWLPKKFQGQVRWLEKAKIWQKAEMDNGRLKWVDKSFVNLSLIPRRQGDYE